MDENSNLAKPRMRIKKTNTVQDQDTLMACTVGDMAWLHQSIRQRRPVHQTDKEGLSAIHLAALHGRLDCLMLLVEKQKIDPNTSNVAGWTPLHLAINNDNSNRSLECVQYLLRAGADPSKTNRDGLTPAHMAAICGSVDCLKELIAVNAIVTQPDERGHTPAFLARLWSHRECMRILNQAQWKIDKKETIKENQFTNKIISLERQGQMKAEQDEEKERKFYGSLAFHDWMEKKQFSMKPYMFGPNPQRNRQESTDQISSLNLLMLDKALEQIDATAAETTDSISSGRAFVTKHTKRLAKQKEALAYQRERLIENIARERRRKNKVVSKATCIVVVHPDSDEEMERIRKNQEEEKARVKEELKKRNGPRSIFSRLAQPKNTNGNHESLRYRQLKNKTKSLMNAR
ncbi:Ankyrin repeat domain-containing protein 53 [Trichoplax sp. H2]|nr:Ankyrin repeat domain-containing protein 53 [Trichoplax sp. H2]|eukprot:RDD38316.1 Ankyrin repeat domain-containing protein 53 [Trichoplax sp. H2]